MRTSAPTSVDGIENVVLIGQKKAVSIAVKNVSGRRRWSKLNEWLRAKPIRARDPIR
jgi:exodeoxyribonuclease V alpha subunit